MSASLYRTARPRFPQYAPDGRGRDYYIKFDNGGYWADQFQLKKTVDYERPRYRNFHTLFHQAAPFKYYGNGAGRETYILQKHGFYHDQKPLCSYQLTDFLRGNCNERFQNINRKYYVSLSEKRYNQKLRNIEKKLIKRLYDTPMNQYRQSINNFQFTEPGEITNTELPKMSKTYTNFPKFNQNQNTNQKTYGNLNINTEREDEKDVSKNYAKSVNKTENCEKTGTTLKNTRQKITKSCNKLPNGYTNYIDPKHDLRFIDCRGKYSRTLNFFNYKPKVNVDKLTSKKFKIVS